MKALTIWQPWASLIMIGAKPYEFRSWAPPGWMIGRRMVIHAAARKVRPEEVVELLQRLGGALGPTPCLKADIAVPFLERLLDEPERLPLSHGLGCVTVGAGKRGDLCAAEFGDHAGNDSDRPGTFNWGWPMLDIKHFEPAVQCKGWQRLWNWPYPEATHG